MWVERLVNDAPGVVDPEHGQIVAVPHAGVLAAEPDQGGIAFEREAIDAPFVGSRVRYRLLTVGDEFVARCPGQLALFVADDAGSGMERSAELGLITRHHPVVVGADCLGHCRDVRLVRPLTYLTPAPFSADGGQRPGLSIGIPCERCVPPRIIRRVGPNLLYVGEL